MSEVCAEALKLVEDALFLRMYGERPPGAPPDNPQAETWADWDHRAELWLRAQPHRHRLREVARGPVT